MFKMERNVCKNLPDIIEVARLLRQGQLFIEQEQTTFANYLNIIDRNSFAIFKVSYFLNINCYLMMRRHAAYINTLCDLLPSSWLIYAHDNGSIWVRRASSNPSANNAIMIKLLNYSPINCNLLNRRLSSTTK